MRRTQDKIWFKKQRHSIDAAISISKSISCLNSATISFGQELEIREQLKQEIYREIFGQMPFTCGVVMRHLKSVEDELRELGHKKLANKLASSRALVDTLRDQMTVPVPEMAREWPELDDAEEN